MMCFMLCSDMCSMVVIACLCVTHCVENNTRYDVHGKCDCVVITQAKVRNHNLRGWKMK